MTCFARRVGKKPVDITKFPVLFSQLQGPTMRYSESRFQCKREHITRSWQWSNIYSIPCQTKGCRLKSHRLLSSAQKLSSERTVYYKSPSGEVFIPGDHTSRRIPKNYTRHEINTFRDRDRFYKEMNLSERITHEQLSEAEEIVMGDMRSQERSDLYHEMQGFSQFGRDAAMAAIRKSNNRTKTYEPRGYLVGWEHDRGNR
jgi:hypothetical protein